MSRINCDTAGDLIPLYVDEVLSPSSVTLVEEHLQTCEDCAKKTAALRQHTVVKNYDEIQPLKKFQQRLLRHKILLGVILAGLAFFGVMTAVNDVEMVYSYNEVKEALRIVKLSECTISDSDNVAVVCDDNKVFQTNAVGRIVGIEDDVMQVEITLYMSRYGSDYIDRMAASILRNPHTPKCVYRFISDHLYPALPAYDPQHPALVYDTCDMSGHPDDNDISDAFYLGENCNTHESTFYMPSIRDDEASMHYEIVSIYYGRWYYPEPWSDEYNRELLWES